MKLKAVALSPLLAIAVATLVEAQTQTPAPLIQVVRRVVKPERRQEWQEITKKFSEAHKKGGGAFRHVWRGRADNIYLYMVVTPIENYAQLDSPDAGRRGMSRDERLQLAEQRRECTQSVEMTIREPIPELTVPVTSDQPPKYMATLTTNVPPGMVTQYIEQMKELATAFKKAGIPAYGVYRTRWGGPRTTFVSWFTFSNMADLDSPDLLLRGMSEDARAKWREKLGPIVESSEWNIWTYYPKVEFSGRRLKTFLSRELEWPEPDS